jgi:hypothetical protein
VNLVQQLIVNQIGDVSSIRTVVGNQNQGSYLVWQLLDWTSLLGLRSITICYMKESGSKLVLLENMSYSNTYFWMQNGTMNSSNTISND